MRILLFISAFLAALTGGVAQARVAGPVAEVSVSQGVRAERERRAAPFVAAAAKVLLDRASFAPQAMRTTVPSRIPLYADRLLI
jgi:hypothetical protein